MLTLLVFLRLLLAVAVPSGLAQNNGSTDCRTADSQDHLIVSVPVIVCVQGQECPEAVIASDVVGSAVTARGKLRVQRVCSSQQSSIATVSLQDTSEVILSTFCRGCKPEANVSDDGLSITVSFPGVVTVQPVNSHKLCWCEPDDREDCSNSTGFGRLVGQLVVHGVSAGSWRTCVRGQPCQFKEVAGVFLQPGDRLAPLHGCPPSRGSDSKIQGMPGTGILETQDNESFDFIPESGSNVTFQPIIDAHAGFYSLCFCRPSASDPCTGMSSFRGHSGFMSVFGPQQAQSFDCVLDAKCRIAVTGVALSPADRIMILPTCGKSSPITRHHVSYNGTVGSSFDLDIRLETWSAAEIVPGNYEVCWCSVRSIPDELPCTEPEHFTALAGTITFWCPPGKFAEVEGEICRGCPENNYCPGNFTSSRISCPGGAVTAGRDASRPSECFCQRGFHAASGDGTAKLHCLQCEQGKFAVNPGQTACEANNFTCVAGHTCNNRSLRLLPQDLLVGSLIAKRDSCNSELYDFTNNSNSAGELVVSRTADGITLGFVGNSFVIAKAKERYPVCFYIEDGGEGAVQVGLEVGSLTVEGPLQGEWTCTLGTICRLNNVQGVNLRPGDRLTVSRLCGTNEIPQGLPSEGLLWNRLDEDDSGFFFVTELNYTWAEHTAETLDSMLQRLRAAAEISQNDWDDSLYIWDVFGNSVSTTGLSESQFPVHIQMQATNFLMTEPGLYYVCFCRPAAGMACEDPAEFRAHAGYLTAEGPHLRQHEISCNVAQTCVVDNVEGVRLSHEDQAMLLKSCQQDTCDNSTSSCKPFSADQTKQQADRFTIDSAHTNIPPGEYRLCWCGGSKCDEPKHFNIEVASVDFYCSGSNEYVEEGQCAICCTTCFLFRWEIRGADDAKSCAFDAKHLIGAHIVVVDFVFLVMVLSFCVGLPILLQDVSSDEVETVVGTATRHFLLKWKWRVPVVFRRTGTSALDRPSQRYTARYRSKRQLYLLDASGRKLTGRFETSMGEVRVPRGYTAMHCGIMGIPFLAWALVLLCVAVITIYECAIDVEEWLALFACALVVSVLWHWLIRRWGYMTPIRESHKTFQIRLPKRPVPCPRGPTRALQVKKLLDLYSHYQAHICGRNMYYICPNIVKPLTKASQLSYAEVAGPEVVNWFISHFWGMAFKHFTASIEKHARSVAGDDSWKTISYWICTFCNNQWNVTDEVGHGSWQESSFNLALHSETCQGTAMVLDDQALPLTRSWCLFEVLQTALRAENSFETHGAFQGLLLCTSSGVLNKGTASMDVATALGRRLSALRVQEASASYQQDKNMIDSLVESMPGGFDAMNEFVHSCIRGCLRTMKRHSDEEFSKLLGALKSKEDGCGWQMLRDRDESKDESPLSHQVEPIYPESIAL